MKSTSSKYRQVRSELETAIRTGEFGVGEQLPSEQALAERFGVSYLTARRAVCELVEEDLLERRARKSGTFVRPHGLAKLKSTTLNLITSAYEGAFHRTFLEHGARLAREQGWISQIVRLSEGQQEPAVKAIRSEDALSLVMLDEFAADCAIGLAVKSVQGRAVVMSREFAGVPSIWTDPKESVRLAVCHLRSLGHREISLVVQDLEDGLNRRHEEAWLMAAGDLFSAEEARRRIVHVETPQFQCPSRGAYVAILDLLKGKSHQVTAFVTFGDEVAQGVLAACHDAGLPIPEAISLVNILDAPAMAFSHPPVTCIDVDLPAQMQLAKDVLTSSLRGELMDKVLWGIAPKLVERESVAAPPLRNDWVVSVARQPASRRRLEATVAELT